MLWCPNRAAAAPTYGSRRLYAVVPDRAAHKLPANLPCRRAKLEQELQSYSLSEEQRAAALAEHEKREREYSRLQRQRLCMDDFEPLRLIGKGAFGEVRICRDRSTGKLVAVKKLKKAEMVRRGQVSMAGGQGWQAGGHRHTPGGRRGCQLAGTLVLLLLMLSALASVFFICFQCCHCAVHHGLVECP